MTKKYWILNNVKKENAIISKIKYKKLRKSIIFTTNLLISKGFLYYNSSEINK